MLANQAVVSFGQVCHKVVCGGQTRGLFDSSQLSARLSKSDVCGDGVAEQKAFLKDKADIAAQVLQIQVPDVDAINQHSSRCHVVESGNQAQQRCLARS